METKSNFENRCYISQYILQLSDANRVLKLWQDSLLEFNRKAQTEFAVGMPCDIYDLKGQFLKNTTALQLLYYWRDKLGDSEDVYLDDCYIRFYIFQKKCQFQIKHSEHSELIKTLDITADSFECGMTFIDTVLDLQAKNVEGAYNILCQNLFKN